MSLKSRVATVAALLALLGGVEVAHAADVAGIVDDVAPVVEGAVPAPEQPDVGAVVDDAAAAVDDAVGAADAEAVAAEAQAAVDGAVADPVGTVENTVEQASGTVDEVVGDARRIADPSPVVKVVTNVTKTPDDPVALATSAPRPEAAGLRPEDATPADKNALASTLAPSATAPGATNSFGRPSSTPSSAMIALDTAPWAQVGWTSWPTDTPALTEPLEVSSGAPAAPFAPFPPGDQPATVATVAGAAGAALLAALFSALLFLAPRTGRLARPGPILVRAEPCLSLPERPG